MLAKMGYTPGTGLGAPDRQGAAEPIVLTMRPARSGLGIAEARRQEQEAAEARHAAQGTDRVARFQKHHTAPCVSQWRSRHSMKPRRAMRLWHPVPQRTSDAGLLANWHRPSRHADAMSN